MKFFLISAIVVAPLAFAAPRVAERGVAEAIVSRPPLRAGAAYEDIADAIGAREKRGIAEEVVTRPPLRAGAAYEDIADALGAKRNINFEIVKVITVIAKE
ncbi:hypothetical protein MMC25_007191 [Agyrium rufum]|nr:hypothetical protein [Agyrium rufum]